jgi:eukaryotic-like serine/threonine-protein kinase
MGFVSFLKSRLFVVNLFLVLLLVFLLSWALLKYLNWYTLHGETITVPELLGLNSEEVAKVLQERDLNFEIIDSLYDLHKPKGVVLDQEPKSNSLVKENRTIYLTLNAVLPPNVKMPNLIDLTYRQAVSMLETYGLKAGTIRYVPDIAINAVIEQELKGKVIASGSLIPKGSTIDLVLGQGEGDEIVPVPQLIGLTVSEATAKLKESFLNIGAILPDNSIKDTSMAKIYKQIPEGNGPGINIGKSVDLFTTQDYSKIINQ